MANDPPRKQLAQLLLQRRKELNIKQESLAELTGVSLRTVRDMEKGAANPSLETAQQVMEALGIELVFKLRR